MEKKQTTSNMELLLNYWRAGITQLPIVTHPDRVTHLPEKPQATYMLLILLLLFVYISSQSSAIG